nr:hypothetical protein [Deinococcus peraridilitoris]
MTIDALEGSLIVSCQAEADSPFRSTEFICAFARAAVAQGARALRLEGLADVRAVRAREQVPIIGIVKRRVREVFITPTVQDAHDLCDAGADIVAFDATHRARAVSPNWCRPCRPAGKSPWPTFPPWPKGSRRLMRVPT